MSRSIDGGEDDIKNSNLLSKMPEPISTDIRKLFRHQIVDDLWYPKLCGLYWIIWMNIWQACTESLGGYMVSN